MHLIDQNESAFINIVTKDICFVQINAVLLNFPFIKESWKNKIMIFHKKSSTTVFNIDNNKKWFMSSILECLWETHARISDLVCNNLKCCPYSRIQIHFLVYRITLFYLKENCWLRHVKIIIMPKWCTVSHSVSLGVRRAMCPQLRGGGSRGWRWLESWWSETSTRRDWWSCRRPSGGRKWSGKHFTETQYCKERIALMCSTVQK